MARTKIVPKGYADIGATDESVDYMDLMKFLTDIGGSMQEAKTGYENKNIQAMNYLIESIDGADSLSDINRYESMYNNLIDPNYISDNNLYNVVTGDVGARINEKKTAISQFNTSATEFASDLMSTNNELGAAIFSLSEDDLMKRYQEELEKNPDFRGDEGWITMMTMERTKLKKYIDGLGAAYGKNAPTGTVKYLDDDGNQKSLSVNELSRHITRYDEVMKGLITTALSERDEDTGAAVLSHEEAAVLATLTGEEGLDVTYLQAHQKEKIKAGQNLYDTGTKGGLYVTNKMSQMAGDEEKYAKLIAGLLGEDPDMINSFNQLSNAPDFAKHNTYATTGNAEEDKKNLINAMLSPDSGYGRQDFMMLLNNINKASVGKVEMGKKMLRAWGGADYFEYKQPKELEDEQIKGDLNLNLEKFKNLQEVKIGKETSGYKGFPFEKDLPATQKLQYEGLPFEQQEAAGNVDEATKDISSEGGSHRDWIIPAAVGIGVSQADNIAKVGTAMATGTQKAAKYLNAALKINASQVKEFINNKTVTSAMNDINKYDDELSELQQKLKDDKDFGKTKKTYQTKHGTKPLTPSQRIQQLKSQRRAISNNVVSKYAKKWGISEQQVGKLFKKSQLDKWNIFKLRGQIRHGLPKIASKLFAPVKAVGNVYLPYTVGYNVTQALGYEDEVSKNVGGIGMIATARKVQKILSTPKGKKALIKFATKAGAKKIGTSLATGAVGGPLAVVTGLIGAGLTGYDLYNWVQSYGEPEVEK